MDLPKKMKKHQPLDLFCSLIQGRLRKSLLDINCCLAQFYRMHGVQHNAKGVFSVAAASTKALSHKTPASTETFRKSYGAADNDKRKPK